MSIKLNKKPRPDDLTAKMPLRLEKGGDIYKDKQGVEGFVEFWSEDATAIKANMTRIGARLTRLEAIRGRRTDEQWRAMTDDAIANENEEYKMLSVEALAIRSKSWYLVDSEGEAQDVAHTMENARDLFGDDEFRAVALDWLKDNKSAFLQMKSEG